MTKHPDPLAWISLRAAEQDFVKFVGASTADGAITAATGRITDDTGKISQPLFLQLKNAYLAHMREALGLPPGSDSLQPWREM